MGIGAILKGVARTAFGIGGGGGGGVATAVADIVERWKPGVTTKHEMMEDIQKGFSASQASARTHDAPAQAGIPIIDGIVNGVNRLIRPGVTLWLLGGITGLWTLPLPGAIEPVWFHFFEIVIMFWFGGRALFKDLPAAVKYFKQLN